VIVEVKDKRVGADIPRIVSEVQSSITSFNSIPLLEDAGPTIIPSRNEVELDDLISDEVMLVLDDMIVLLEERSTDSFSNESFKPISMHEDIARSAESASQEPNDDRSSSEGRTIIRMILNDIIELVEKKNALAIELGFSFNFPRVGFAERSLPASLLPEPPHRLDTISELSLGPGGPLTAKISKSVRFYFDAIDEEEATLSSEMVSTRQKNQKKEFNQASDFVIVSSSKQNDVATQQSFGISVPELPQSLQVGFTNPEDLQHDPNYWQASFYRQRSEDERRLDKFKRLPLLREHYEILRNGKLYVQSKKQIEEFKLFKEDLKEDFLDTIEPIAKQLQALMVRLRPYLLRFKVELNKILATFSVLARSVLSSRHATMAPQLCNALIKLEKLATTSNESAVADTDNAVRGSMIDDTKAADRILFEEVLVVMNDLLGIIVKKGKI
jgi:hypothetical protein